MGKASKWFRGLLGLKKPDSSTSSSPSQPSTTSKPPPKKKWSFVKSYREKDHQDFHNKPIQRSGTELTQSFDNDDPSNHAIAVAEATKAVAEAAVAAAEAAAAVVRLTSSGRAITTNATTTTTTMLTPSFGTGAAVTLNSSTAYLTGRCVGYGDREEWAAVKIQSHFRAYLSRRALQALKALVRLQALIRGELVRKHAADMLQRMQVLVRAQARARTGRAQIFESPVKSNQFNYPGPATPEKFEHMVRARSMKRGENLMFRRNCLKSNGKVNSNQDKECMDSNWMDSEMDVRSWEREGSSMRANSREDQKSDRILEVDNGKPHTMPKRRNLFHSCHPSLGLDQYSHSFTTSKESTAHQTALSPSSCEVQSWRFSQDDEEPYCTADSSPQFYSASSKGGTTNRGPFTPTKSDCSKSCLSGYSDHPNYMAYTESSKAKMRSLSAPKQRPQYERSSSTKRYSIHGYGDSRVTVQKVSSLHANFTNKAYPGSGRLERLGMPVREELISFTCGHWHRY